MTLTDKEQRAVKILGDYFRASVPAHTLAKTTPPIPSAWISRNYYIPETGRTIELQPHQAAFTNLALDEAHNFRTIIYSTIKKSGKSAWAGAVCRYLAEHSGHRAEILTVGNDLNQARSRTYNSLVSSIELTPGFDKARNALPGRWRIIEKHAVHLPTNSTVRAIANDFAGEAGANPVCVAFTELWGLNTPKGKKLWAELTTSPIRKRSMRIVETYAGYEDESDILLDLYKLGLEGRRLTHDDIDWRFPDQPPIWINERARLIMYWDSGYEARRMPWQQGPEADAYYESERQTLDEVDFKRMHLNEWQSSLNEFIRPEWWASCYDPNLPALRDRNTPCVLGVDASISNDCTALALVSRHYDPSKQSTDVAVRDYRVWYPSLSAGHTIDYREVEETIRWYCANYNIVQIAYDQFQLYHMMSKLTEDAVAWCKVFGQQNPRAIADKQLYDLIKNRHLIHDGNPEYLQFVKNAAAKKTALTQEKLRIEKKDKKSPVDLLVAISMAASECLRLNL